MREFASKKELDAWFRSLPVEGKRAHGRFYNERKRAFEGASGPGPPRRIDAIRAKHPGAWTEGERSYHDEYFTCHACGYTHECRCWKRCRARLSPLWGVPVNAVFFVGGECFTKDRIDAIDSMDRDLSIDLEGFWAGPAEYRLPAWLRDGVDIPVPDGRPVPHE